MEGAPASDRPPRSRRELAPPSVRARRGTSFILQAIVLLLVSVLSVTFGFGLGKVDDFAAAIGLHLKEPVRSAVIDGARSGESVENGKVEAEESTVGAVQASPATALQSPLTTAKRDARIAPTHRPAARPYTLAPANPKSGDLEQDFRVMQ
jgi:hypothetical protein